MQPNPTKTCSKCGFVGDAALFSGKTCRPCVARRVSRWRSANKERDAEAKKRWHEANREKVRAYLAAWYIANKEPHAANCAQYHAKNREAILAAQREYYRTNKAKIDAQVRKIQDSNRERYNKYSREWYSRNREQHQVATANRKARVRGVGGKHSLAQIQSLFASQCGLCAACGVDISENVHKDHIMPISLGGSNDISNIQLLCPPCNRRKRAKHPDEWRRELKNGV